MAKNIYGIVNMKMKIGDMECRTCGENLLGTLPHVTAEIVKWNGTSCYTLAFWKRNCEYFDLQFIDDRPFGPDIDMSRFMLLAGVMQKHLGDSRNVTWAVE